MKKNLVKKTVLPVFVALLCSVIALTGVSYAWFSMGNTATVKGMDMEVTAADGLQISASGDATSFKSTLILTQSKTNAKAVSTDGTYNSGLKFYTGQIVEGQLGQVAEAAGTDYIMFDIYVKVSSATKLQLDKESVVAAVANAKNSTLQTNLAARVAFVDLGSATTPDGAKALAPAAGTVKIWEPNSTTRSTAAANAGAQAGKLDYKGIVSTAGAESRNNVATFDFIGENEDKSVELFELEAGYNKVRVYIWLEGQDIDCVNEVSGGKFSITLNLSKPQAQNQQNQ